MKYILKGPDEAVFEAKRVEADDEGEKDDEAENRNENVVAKVSILFSLQ